MRPRLYLLTAIVTSIVVGGVVVVSVALASITGDDGDDAPPSDWVIPATTAPLPDGSPAPRLDPPTEPSPEPAPPGPRLDLTAEVSVEIDGFLRWAAMELATGEEAYSRNPSRTSTTESMIKAWIAADFLRRQTEAGEEPSEERLADASRAIRISHDGAAERLYADGGHDAVVERMIDMCGLTDTEIEPFFWSRTKISARDAARVGACIADGTAAGPEWTDWLLEEMRQVEGSVAAEDQSLPGGGEGGHWGIVDGLPEQVLEQGVAIKNGWTAIGRTGNWHVVCLAITDEWVMAVVMQYPARNGLEYGAERCASVAEQLVPELGGAVPGLE